MYELVTLPRLEREYASVIAELNSRFGGDFAVHSDGGYYISGDLGDLRVFIYSGDSGGDLLDIDAHNLVASGYEVNVTRLNEDGQNDGDFVVGGTENIDLDEIPDLVGQYLADAGWDASQPATPRWGMAEHKQALRLAIDALQRAVEADNFRLIEKIGTTEIPELIAGYLTYMEQ